jgi:hypothetical protein
MKKLLALGAALVTAVVFAATAAGAAPGTVSIVGCVLVHGGSATVSAGSDVTFHFGWVSKKSALSGVFLKAETTTAAVDGNPIANADAYWSAPYIDPATGNSVTDWTYDTGTTLGAGDSLTLTFDITLAHAVADGFNKKEGGNGPASAGTLISGTCTVTGV